MKRMIFASVMLLTLPALFVSMLCTPSACLAQSTPEAVVKEMIAAIKQKGSPLPVMDYVHWDTAFKNLAQKDRAKMEVSSATELQGFYRELLESPEAFMKKRFEKQLATLPPEQQEMMRGQFTQMSAMMQQQQAKQQDKINRTTYTIGESSIDGSNATVKLQRTIDGKTKTDELNLIKVGKRWYMSTLDSVGSATGKQ